MRRPLLTCLLLLPLVSLAADNDARDTIPPARGKCRAYGMLEKSILEKRPELLRFSGNNELPLPNTEQINALGQGLKIFANPQKMNQSDYFDHQGNKYTEKGFELIIANNTDNIVRIPSCNNVLYVLCEAELSHENWKPIEYMMLTWCGTSYQTVSLASGHHWNFSIPPYSGKFKTKLRFHLYGSPNSRFPREISDVYSNVFEGSIDPGQLGKANTYHLRREIENLR